MSRYGDPLLLVLPRGGDTLKVKWLGGKILVMKSRQKIDLILCKLHEHKQTSYLMENGGGGMEELGVLDVLLRVCNWFSHVPITTEFMLPILQIEK